MAIRHIMNSNNFIDLSNKEEKIKDFLINPEKVKRST